MAIARVQSKAANSTTKNTTVTFDTPAAEGNLGADGDGLLMALSALAALVAIVAVAVRGRR